MWDNHDFIFFGFIGPIILRFCIIYDLHSNRFIFIFLFKYVFMFILCSQLLLSCCLEEYWAAYDKLG